MNYKDEDLNTDRRCLSTKSYAPVHASWASVAADVPYCSLSPLPCGVSVVHSFNY